MASVASVLHQWVLRAGSHWRGCCGPIQGLGRHGTGWWQQLWRQMPSVCFQIGDSEENNCAKSFSIHLPLPFAWWACLREESRILTAWWKLIVMKELKILTPNRACLQILSLRVSTYLWKATVVPGKYRWAVPLHLCVARDLFDVWDPLCFERESS